MTIVGSTFFGGTMTSTQHMPPGWYPDQHDSSVQRYWNGQRWTGHAKPAPPPPDTASGIGVASALTARWKALRTRTKVAIVVVALLLFGALVPNTEAAPDDESATPADTPADAQTVEPVEERQTADPTAEPEPVMAVVPKLTAMQLDAAKSRLRRADLALRVVKQSSWKAAGVILAQRTASGTEVNPGRVITLVVAAAMPTVPGVVGRTAQAGAATLVRAGFEVRVLKEVVTSGTTGVILRQTPVGTTQTAPGSVVQIVVANVVRPVAPPAPVSNCTSGYSPCLAPAPDYDCAGGSGDGPQYTGFVRVTGSDPYDLDADGDGVACE